MFFLGDILQQGPPFFFPWSPVIVNPWDCIRNKKHKKIRQRLGKTHASFVGHLTVGGCIFGDESSGVQTSTKGSERWRRLRVRSRSLWRGDTLKSLRLWQEIYSYPPWESLVLRCWVHSDFLWCVVHVLLSLLALHITSWQKVAVLPAAINLEEEIGTEPLIDCDNPKTMNHTCKLIGQYLIYLPVVSEVGL